MSSYSRSSSSIAESNEAGSSSPESLRDSSNARWFSVPKVRVEVVGHRWQHQTRPRVMSSRPGIRLTIGCKGKRTVSEVSRDNHPGFRDGEGLGLHQPMVGEALQTGTHFPLGAQQQPGGQAQVGDAISLGKAEQNVKGLAVEGAELHDPCVPSHLITRPVSCVQFLSRLRKRLAVDQDRKHGMISPNHVERLRAIDRSYRLATCTIVASCISLQCQFDRSDRWDDLKVAATEQCTPGDTRCTSRLELCVQQDGRGMWTVQDDCSARGWVCAPSLLRCTVCLPDERSCDGQTVRVCEPDGSDTVELEECDGDSGEACRSGACANLCMEAAKVKSNVGCEYWAADLDNANIDATSNAAAQQYAIVVSNPQEDIGAQVAIEIDDAQVGETSKPREVATALIPPLGLRVFKLGPREVDGSEPGNVRHRARNGTLPSGLPAA